MSEWKPIKTAPKDGSAFIAWFSESHGKPYAETVYWDNGHYYWLHDGDSPIVPPTHWIPLPEPPK